MLKNSIKNSGGLVFFVAPLPPPVHGFSEISRRMLSVLQSQYMVLNFDMTPSRNVLWLLGEWRRFFHMLLIQRPNSLYLALSGGYRQWIDLSFSLVARLCGVPVFVHHHSFSYLNERRFSSAVLFRALPGAKHIVLCSCMAEKLVKLYGIKQANVRVLSNTAFLEDIDKSIPPHSPRTPLRVGFLSNITAEKGIFEYFSVLNESAKAGLELQGVIAGPVGISVKASFDACIVGSKNAHHIGPVYGVNKTAYFASIDVLLFPTRYANEAEPVTILEALGHGVPVIAFARGCINGMVPASAGAVFPYSDAFIKQTIEELRPLAENPAQLAKARLAARAAFEAGRVTNKAVLESLVAEMGGNATTELVSG